MKIKIIKSWLPWGRPSAKIFPDDRKGMIEIDGARWEIITAFKPPKK